MKHFIKLTCSPTCISRVDFWLGKWHTSQLKSFRRCKPFFFRENSRKTNWYMQFQILRWVDKSPRFSFTGQKLPSLAAPTFCGRTQAWPLTPHVGHYLETFIRGKFKTKLFSKSLSQRRRRHFKSGQATTNKRSLVHVYGGGGSTASSGLHHITSSCTS